MWLPGLFSLFKIRFTYQLLAPQQRLHLISRRRHSYSLVQIDDEETKKRVQELIAFIETNRDEIQKMQLKNAPFTWQTATRALDDLMAYTSRNVEQTIRVVETAIRQELAKAGFQLVAERV